MNFEIGSSQAMNTKRKWLFLIAAAAVFFSTVSLVKTADSRYGHPKGRVKVNVEERKMCRKHSASNLEGATVKLYTRWGEIIRSARSNHWGRADFERINKGSYFVTCQKKGYVNAWNPWSRIYKTAVFRVRGNETIHNYCFLRPTISRR